MSDHDHPDFVPAVEVSSRRSAAVTWVLAAAAVLALAASGIVFVRVDGRASKAASAAVSSAEASHDNAEATRRLASALEDQAAARRDEAAVARRRNAVVDLVGTLLCLPPPADSERSPEATLAIAQACQVIKAEQDTRPES